MNFITWNKAYCLFPRRTCRAEMQLIVRKLENYEKDAVAKLHGRGFSVVFWSDMPYDDEIAAARRVGDRYTWMVQLADPYLRDLRSRHRVRDHTHNISVENLRFSLGVFGVHFLLPMSFFKPDLS